jgi:hypothetical protein
MPNILCQIFKRGKAKRLGRILPALVAIVRVGLKCLVMINALAYYARASVTNVEKCFCYCTPKFCYKKLFTLVINCVF